MRRKTRTRRGKPLYSDDHKDHLLTGHDFFGGGFGNGDEFREEDAAEAWEVLQEELLWAHISERPCTRPWAWWYFGDRDPRLCIDSVKGEPEADDCDGSDNYGCESPYLGFQAERLHFESQAHYLRRYGLLTKAERAYLEKHPELLEPVPGHRVRDS